MFHRIFHIAAVPVPVPAPAPVLAAALLLAAVTGAFSAAAHGAEPVQAQNVEASLRRENQQLADRVRALEKELDAARSRIARLEAQLQSQAKPGGTSAGEPTTGSGASSSQETSSASPAALRSALIREHEQLLAAMPTHEGDARAVIALRRASRVIVTAIDPATHAEQGEPFSVTLPRAVATRFERLLERGRPEVLVLRGTLVPMLRLMDDEATRIPGFDTHRYIGEWVEFRFAIEVASLSPPAEDESRAAAASTTQPPSARTTGSPEGK